MSTTPPLSQIDLRTQLTFAKPVQCDINYYEMEHSDQSSTYSEYHRQSTLNALSDPLAHTLDHSGNTLILWSWLSQAYHEADLLDWRICWNCSRCIYSRSRASGCIPKMTVWSTTYCCRKLVVIQWWWIFSRLPPSFSVSVQTSLLKHPSCLLAGHWRRMMIISHFTENLTASIELLRRCKGDGERKKKKCLSIEYPHQHDDWIEQWNNKHANVHFTLLLPSR